MCGAGQLSTFLRFGNDGGRGKGLGVSEKFKPSTQGSPLSIEGLPRVQQVRAGHSSFSGKTGLQEPVPSPGRGPWEAGGGRGRGGEHSARLRMFPAQSWPQCKKLFTLLEESLSLIGSWRREMAGRERTGRSRETQGRPGCSYSGWER